MNRLFVALDLPTYAKDAISVMQQGLPDVRWSDSDTLHVTLAFLGEVDRPTFRESMEALADVETAPFALELAGLGHFPPRGEPRQLWVGVKAVPELVQLQKRVERALRDIGVAIERRRFLPHVTIARFRYPPPQPRLQAFFHRHGLFRLPPLPVSAFHLYSSWLGNGPAHYEIEASYELVPGAEEDVAAGR
ncbi:MAG: RNA 2',3'-cyclic phosphodiesterase [Pseudomonadota bacterium]